MDKVLVDTNIILRILIQGNEHQKKKSENLIFTSKQNNLSLYLPPVTIMEIVWVLEKVYKLTKKAIRELTEAILNTPELNCIDDEVFRKALILYEEKNIKFGDAVISSWGLSNGFTTIYTFDEKDFKRVEGLEVRKP